MNKKINLKQVVKENLLIISLLLLVLAIHIKYALMPARFLWDESIYVGLAKHLFSNGALGFWEVFRPIGLPVVLGGLWKLGLSPLIVGKILAVIAYMIVLLLAYFMANKYKKNAGIYAFFLAASIPMLFKFSNAVLTDVIAVALGLGALYLAYKEKYFLAGVLSGLAFVFRFPYGLIIISVYFCILLDLFKDKNKYSFWQRIKINFKSMFKKGLIASIGLAIIISVYAVFNYIKYDGDVLLPLKAANIMMNQVGVFLYMQPPTFYLLVLLRENLALIFLVIFLGMYMFDKKLRENKLVNLLLFSFFVFLIYFTQLIHKESRYILFLLPIMAILGGIVLLRLEEYFNKRKRKRKNKKSARKILISICICLLLLTTVSIFYGIDKRDVEEMNFYKYFNNDTDGLLLATNPTYMLFTDKPVMFLASWSYSNEVYAKNKDKVDYISINSCDYVCEPNTSCLNDKKRFYENVLNNLQVVYNNTYLGCEHIIYKVTK
ncbi:MAG: glycosyltransferase family 39 protein [Candidatus Woesearchaeota archaeon]|jgi:4-amino-4-deoxy-L-arabinose transferase-like glycosyltransferase